MWTINWISVILVCKIDFSIWNKSPIPSAGKKKKTEITSILMGCFDKVVKVLWKKSCFLVHLNIYNKLRNPNSICYAQRIKKICSNETTTCVTINHFWSNWLYLESPKRPSLVTLVWISWSDDLKWKDILNLGGTFP